MDFNVTVGENDYTADLSFEFDGEWHGPTRDHPGESPDFTWEVDGVKDENGAEVTDEAMLAKIKSALCEKHEEIECAAMESLELPDEHHDAEREFY